MPWNGYQDNQSDVGEGWEDLENCSFYVKNECRRRLGFGDKVDLSGAVVRSATELGGYALLATAAGAILSVTQSSGAVASVTTGLSTTNWPTWTTMNGRAYFTNGVDTKVSDTGTTVRAIGIAAPSVAATSSTTGSGGVVTAGAHLIRYRYYDSTRNRFSNPSTAAAALTITAGQKISAGYTASGDSNVDKIIIEMTAAGASTYYRAATITNSGSSTTIDMSDETLILQIAATRDGEYQHLQPPTYGIIGEGRQRLWLWDTATGALAWSRALYPESWDSVNYSRIVTLDGGDTPSALASFYSDIYAIGQHSMKRVVYSTDPAAAMVIDVPGNHGCFNPRCLLKTDSGILFGWGRNGAWMIDAMLPKKISMGIDETIDSLASPTAMTQRFIAYEPTRREVAFFFPLSGETTCKAAAVFSLDTQQWTLWKFRQPMTAGVLNTNYSDRQRLMLCDSNGYAWRMGVSANDGGGNGVVTATSGSTTTVINCTNSATTGQILYNPTTGQERTISAATGSTITVSSAFSSAPSAGTVLYVGSIRHRIKREWDPLEGMDSKKRPDKFLIAVRPEGTMGTAEVNFYTDFSSTAEVVTANAADTYPEGVSITGNQITVNFDTGAADGFLPVPTVCEWKRVVSAEIIAEYPGDGVRFLDASFSPGQQMEEKDE